MPTRDAALLGAPCWNDLYTSDPDRAEEFYGRVLGWTAERLGEEYGGYVLFRRNDAMIAGMMRTDGATGQPDTWTTYLATADAKATTEAAVAAGGQVLLEPMQVMQLGTMGMLADPGGAVVGLWEPAAHQGFGLVGEAGAPVWHELHTRDYARVLEFYRAALGWRTVPMSDTDEFRYTTMEDENGSHAGVMDARGFLPEGVPSNWQVYFGAQDVDATLAMVVELGGSVLQPAEDSPYGRLAQVADPTGAVFKLASLQA
jgi:uncharacterized protein